MPLLGRLDSTHLLMRIFERPELVAAVRELPAPVLAKLIDHVGLEDAGELVALATPAQLQAVFDEDLFRADAPGADEQFRPERFALWLQVMQEAGEAVFVQRLCELPRDLFVLAVHRLVLVVYIEALAERLLGARDELEDIERAIENVPGEEWEEFRLFARDPMHWDMVWYALQALDRDHHELLREVLEQCCALSDRYFEENGGLYEVLTSDEFLESEVAAEREDRRAAEGFVSPADARSFLELARLGVELDRRDAIAAAYFRTLTPAGTKAASERAASVERTRAHARVEELVTVLEQAEVLQPTAARPRAALPSGATRRDKPVTLFGHAMAELDRTRPALFAERVEELGFLANVLIAGGAYESRRPRPAEAFEYAMELCDRGLRRALASVAASHTLENAVTLLAETPADRLFRRGFAADPR